MKSHFLGPRCRETSITGLTLPQNNTHAKTARQSARQFLRVICSMVPDVRNVRQIDTLKGWTHLVSACEGLGTAGDACPVVLPCTRGSWTPIGCAVEELTGFGYNPSAIPAPAAVKDLVYRRLNLNISFLGTTRKWRWSERCDNEYTRRRDWGPGGRSGRPTRSQVPPPPRAARHASRSSHSCSARTGDRHRRASARL